MSRNYSWIRATASSPCFSKDAERPRRHGLLTAPFAADTSHRLNLHDDPELGHGALPPARRRPGVGFHQAQQPPLGASECATIRSPIGAPLRRRTHRILDEEMRQLRPHRQRPDRTEPGGQEIIPGRPSLPGDRQDLGGVPWVRCGSHEAIEVWRRPCAPQHAVGDDGGSEGQGPGGVGRTHGPPLGQRPNSHLHGSALPVRTSPMRAVPQKGKIAV